MIPYKYGKNRVFRVVRVLISGFFKRLCYNHLICFALHLTSKYRPFKKELTAIL